jgi:hypothetical protein
VNQSRAGTEQRSSQSGIFKYDHDFVIISQFYLLLSYLEFSPEYVATYTYTAAQLGGDIHRTPLIWLWMLKRQPRLQLRSTMSLCQQLLYTPSISRDQMTHFKR